MPSDTVSIAIVVGIVVIVAAFIMAPRLRRVVFGPSGAELEASESATQDKVSSVSGAKIRQSENVELTADGAGSSVSNVSSDGSKGVKITSKTGK